MTDESTIVDGLIKYLKQPNWIEFSWPFLLTSLVIMAGAYIYWSRRDGTAIGFKSALKYLFPKSTLFPS